MSSAHAEHDEDEADNDDSLTTVFPLFMLNNLIMPWHGQWLVIFVMEMVVIFYFFAVHNTFEIVQRNGYAAAMKANIN